MFQNPDDQIFNLTVYKEIEYGLKKSKLSVEERERWIQDAAELTGIEQYLESNPYDLPLSTRKFVTIATEIGMPEHTLDVRKVAEYIKAGS